MTRRQEPGSSNKRMANRARAKVMVAFLIVVLLVAFALENSQQVTVDYLYGTRDSRLAYVIFGSAIFGALADRLLVRLRR